MPEWNEPIPDKSTSESRAEAKLVYAALDRRGKLLADLRALSDAPGSAATIMSAAADEIEWLCSILKEAADQMDRCDYPCDQRAYRLRERAGLLS